MKDDGQKQLIGGMYDETNKTIKFLTNKTGKFTIRENSVLFEDLLSHKWAEGSISSMAAKGIIVGRTKDEFDPAVSITRAEFSVLIARTLKLNDDIDKILPFEDVKEDSWYYKSILAVYDNGLASGKSSTSFDPNGNITREEITTIVGDVLADNLYKTQDTKTLTKFNDMDHISKWAQQGAAMSAHNQLIKGYNDNFMPKENATRAETAAILDSLYRLILE